MDRCRSQTTAPVSTIRINVAGTLWFDTNPWFFSHGGYYIEGVGGGSGEAAVYAPEVRLIAGAKVAADFVVRGNVHGLMIKGFEGVTPGYGVWTGYTPYAASGPSSVQLDNLTITTNSGSGSPALPFRRRHAFTCEPTTTRCTGSPTGPAHPPSNGPAVLTTGMPPAALTLRICSRSSRDSLFDMPAGGLGSLRPPSHRHHRDGNRRVWAGNPVWWDNSATAPGTIPAALLELACSRTFSVFRLGRRAKPLARKSVAAGGLTVNVNGGGGYSAIGACGPDPSCDLPGASYTAIDAQTVVNSGATGGSGVEIAPYPNGGIVFNGQPLLMYYKGPISTQPLWGIALPAPDSFAVTAVGGSGGLSAGTYCMVMVGVDNQLSVFATYAPGLTLPSAEVCSDRAGQLLDLATVGRGVTQLPESGVLDLSGSITARADRVAKTATYSQPEQELCLETFSPLLPLPARHPAHRRRSSPAARRFLPGSIPPTCFLRVYCALAAAIICTRWGLAIRIRRREIN